MFKVGAGTPIESFYLATNTLPVRHVIIGRRLMFLWTILQKSESDLTRKCLSAQQLNPVRNDLATTFQNDLEMCGITLGMTEISNMKKATFRRLVNTQIKELAREYLVNMKNNHTKMNKISDSYIFEPYLLSTNISTEEKQTLFKFRTRMVEVKSNFKTKYGQNLSCNFCPEEETQIHLLSCKELVKDLDMSNIEYDDIFKDITRQEKAAKELNKILKERNNRLK